MADLQAMISGITLESILAFFLALGVTIFIAISRTEVMADIGKQLNLPAPE